MAGSTPPGPAAFYLTRTAALDLRGIHARSRREWGEAVAERYIADLYAAMRQAAQSPAADRLRQGRSLPFSMVPARRHFIIYDRLPQGIVVLTVQHQVRDIETLIASLPPAFHAELQRLRQSIQQAARPTHRKPPT
ncbi:MAG: type II toxin-antitoxin system RelE/ParE family toxin [Proteobacteria bacterium]|nr:type II toxin-antitoxin system RelE/ParE family toxin [Pseudomonadota bacterium]